MKSLEEIDNKYKNWYFKLIESSKNIEFDEYTEKHHIIPRCLGGGDEPVNIVKLSSRRHFIAHAILAKVFDKHSMEWYKMNNAFLMMKCSPINSSNSNRYINSRIYESFRSNFSVVMKKLQRGERNSAYGSKWISNIEQKINKKLYAGESLPDGWVYGRNQWKNNHIDLLPINCQKCSKKFQPRAKNARFCSNKCANKFNNSSNKYMTKIEKNGNIKSIKLQNRNSYLKCGWKEV